MTDKRDINMRLTDKLDRLEDYENNFGIDMLTLCKFIDQQPITAFTAYQFDIKTEKPFRINLDNGVKLTSNKGNLYVFRNKRYPKLYGHLVFEFILYYDSDYRHTLLFLDEHGTSWKLEEEIEEELTYG